MNKGKRAKNEERRQKNEVPRKKDNWFALSSSYFALLTSYFQRVYRARYVGKRLKHGGFCDPVVCTVSV